MAKVSRTATRRLAGGALTRKQFHFPKTTSRPELLEKEKDSRFRKLIYELSYLGALLDRARQHLADQFGLTPPQYNIIMVIAQLQDAHGVTVIDIANRLHVTGAFVTTQAHGLIADGMIDKLPNPADGRSVLLRLSAHAEDEILRVSPHIREVNDRIFASLDRDHFMDLSTTVSCLIAGGERAVAESVVQSGTFRLNTRRATARSKLGA